MYVIGQEIEHANGLRAKVSAVFEDGGFIIRDLETDWYAACWRDLTRADEDWSFIIESDPWVQEFVAAVQDYIDGGSREQ